jgi:hypothetical protein
MLYISPKNRPWRHRGGIEVCLCSFFNFVARWGWVIIANARPLYQREIELVPGVQRAGWAHWPGLDGCGKSHPPPPQRYSIPDRPAPKELLYWLRYHAIQGFSEPGPRRKLGPFDERWNLKGTYALNNCVSTYKALHLAFRSQCQCFNRFGSWPERLFENYSFTPSSTTSLYWFTLKYFRIAFPSITLHSVASFYFLFTCISLLFIIKSALPCCVLQANLRYPTWLCWGWGGGRVGSGRKSRLSHVFGVRFLACRCEVRKPNNRTWALF